MQRRPWRRRGWCARGIVPEPKLWIPRTSARRAGSWTDGLRGRCPGDVDANGVFSTFAIAGTFDHATGQFTLSPVFEHDPEE